MKISKVKIGILFFIVFIFLIETISFSIYKLQETEKDDIKASKDSIIEDNQSELNEEEQEVLNLINKYRNENGLEDLKIYSKLQETAKIKAKDLEKNNYFSHISPNFGVLTNLLDKNGVYYKVAGENLAGNINSKKAVEAWINSESHKNNILDEQFTYTGISVVDSSIYGKIFVQMFIGLD